MLLRLSFIGLLLWAVYTIPSQFLNLDFFQIKKINIGENSEKINQELTALGEKLYNKNIWNINMDSLEKTLEQDIRLQEAEIRHERAGELDIRVEEKELEYYAQIDNRIYLMDKKGTVFGYLKERDSKSLPLLVAKEGKDLDKLVEILSVLQDYTFYEHISQVYEVDENRVEMILVDGAKVITNISVEKEKYKVAMALYLALSKTKKIAYMDIRFQDFIIRYVEDENGTK